MKKFMVSATTAILLLSLGVDADAAIKTVSKNVTLKGNKLVYKSNGKTVKGFVSFKNKVYQNGYIYTGLKGNTYYKRGIKASGLYKNKMYQNGKLYTGVVKEIFYKKGVKASGTVGGKLYVKGTLFSGVRNNIVYEAGEPLNGTKDKLFYQNGVLYTGTIDSVRYDKGKRVEGLVDDLFYQKGKLFTGVLDQVLYMDGKNPTGYKVFEKQLYKDGALETSVVKVNNIWYAGGQVATGKIVSQEGQQLVVTNGREVEEEAVLNDKDEVSTVVEDDSEEPTDTSNHDEEETLIQPNPENIELQGYEVINGSLYYNGQLYTAKFVYNYALYDGGKLAVGVEQYHGLYYKNGVLAAGEITYNGKTFTVQNGAPLNGVVAEKYYENGVLATGIVNRIYYKNGVQATGREWYDDVFFINGEQVDDIFEDNGKYYLNGKLATGSYATNIGVRYIVNGVLANGLYSGIYYENGERLKGLALKDGKLYKDGVLNIGIVKYDDGDGVKWYYNALVANGVLFTQNGDEIAVKEGKGITGFYNNTYYINGKLEQGLVMHNGELYKDGRPNNTFVQYGVIWYSRTKPANGIHQIGNKTILFENGVKFKGVYADRLYEDGVLKLGEHIENGILYVDGVIKTKTLYDGKLYVLGRLADDFTAYDGKLYQAGGILSVGSRMFNGTLYKNGLIDTEKQLYEGYLYVNGKVSIGADEFQGQPYINGIRVP